MNNNNESYFVTINRVMKDNFDRNGNRRGRISGDIKGK